MWLFAHQGDASVGTYTCVWMCTASVNVYVPCYWWQWRVVLVASKDDDKSPSCCHKTQPRARLLSATSTLRELQTHYRVGGGRRRKREKKAEGKRAWERSKGSLEASGWRIDFKCSAKAVFTILSGWPPDSTSIKTRIISPSPHTAEPGSGNAMVVKNKDCGGLFWTMAL